MMAGTSPLCRNLRVCLVPRPSRATAFNVSMLFSWRRRLSLAAALFQKQTADRFVIVYAINRLAHKLGDGQYCNLAQLGNLLFVGGHGIGDDDLVDRGFANALNGGAAQNRVGRPD